MPSDTAGKRTTSPLSDGSRVPAYQRIEEDIRTKVRDGRLPAGTMLASRHNLAREYGVALSTAQQAIANLIADGVLETFDRRGTFVTRPTENGGSVAQQGGGNGAKQVLKSAAPACDSLVFAPAPRTTATLGIVATARIDTTALPDVGSLWARLAIRSLEHVFSLAGGTTRYFDRYPYADGSVDDDANAVPLSDAIASLRSEGVDAIAVVGLCDAKDMSDEVVRAVDVEHVPTVYISWHEVQPPLAQVFYDNRYAGYQAAQHLLRQGYRRIIFIAPFTDGWLTERIEGARNAIRHAGLPAETLKLYPAAPLNQPYDWHSSAAAVLTMAQEAFGAGWDEFCPAQSGLCGLIAPNDDIAYAFLKTASEQGKIAGRDFGLVGFDDDPRSCTAGLTTVRPPVEAMGEEAGRLLLRALEGEKKGHLARLRSHLIPRASTSPRPEPRTQQPRVMRAL